MRIAYLVNEYPKVSHSFIRREILALEQLGVHVDRFTVRAAAGVLPDEADRREHAITRALITGRVPPLLPTLKLLVSNPGALSVGAFNAVSAALRSDKTLGHHAAYLVEACALRAYAKERDVTHVHAHFGTNSATVAWLCFLLGGPRFSFTVHGPEEFDRAPVIALREKLAAASFVAAISEYGRSQLLRLLPRSQWDKVKVIRCGLESELLDRAPSPVPKAPRFVCVARLSEQKGHGVLLDAASALKTMGRNFELVLAGDGELRHDVEQRIRALGLEDNVRITGYLSAEGVVRELEAARALVLPSFAEGLPVVIMEAMALARPVIATYVAGVPELVEPGRSGWLVPAGSTQALVDACSAVLDAPEEYLTELGNAGRERVRVQHDIRTSAETLFSALKLAQRG